MTTQLVIDSYGELSVWEITAGVVSSYLLPPDDYRYLGGGDGESVAHVLVDGTYIDAPVYWYPVGGGPGVQDNVLTATTALATPAPLGISFGWGSAVLGVQGDTVAIYESGEGAIGYIRYRSVLTGVLLRSCALSLASDNVNSNVFVQRVAGGLVLQFAGDFNNRAVLLRGDEVFTYGASASLLTMADIDNVGAYSYSEGLWQFHTGTETYTTPDISTPPTLAPWAGNGISRMVQSTYSLDGYGSIWRGGVLEAPHNIIVSGATDEYVVYRDGSVHLIGATTGGDIDLGISGNVLAVYQFTTPKFWRASKPYTER